MKIGILGGTFDPIHEGHLAVACAARDEFCLDKVIFVPAFVPPNKTSRSDITLASNRYRMVELAIEQIPSFEVSDLEIKRTGISYTIDTLRELRKIYPDAEFFLIVGADTLKDIPNWRESEEIKKLVRFLVAPRSEQEKPDASWHSRTQSITMREYPFSSSEIREKIRQGKNVSHMLPKGVEEFIRRMKLYGMDKTCPLP